MTLVTDTLSADEGEEPPSLRYLGYAGSATGLEMSRLDGPAGNRLPSRIIDRQIDSTRLRKQQMSVRVEDYGMQGLVSN